MKGAHRIVLVRGSGLSSAPGVIIPTGTLVIELRDGDDHLVPSMELECHVVFGGGSLFDDPLRTPKQVVRGTSDAFGRWSLPEFQLGPEAGPNRLLVQSLHAVLTVDVASTWTNVSIDIVSPRQGDETLASWDFNVELRVVDTSFNNAAIPAFPIEIEVLEGEASLTAANGALGRVAVQRTSDDGTIRLRLRTGYRQEGLLLRFTPYWQRLVAAKELRLRIRAPTLLTYRVGGVPVSPENSLPLPFRSGVSRDGTLPVAVNAGIDLQGRFAVSRIDGPGVLHPKFAGQFTPEWSWYVKPSAVGAIRAHLRLPDHPETAELSEAWTIAQHPYDGPPWQFLGPGGGTDYVHTTFGGSRDQNHMLEARLVGPLVQFVGPNAKAPKGIRIVPNILPPPPQFPTRNIIEVRLRCKVRVSPFNSAVDDATNPTVLPGTIAQNPNGPWADEFTHVFTPGGGTATALNIYFQSPAGNWDHHVEVTAQVTLREVVSGAIQQRDEDTTILLRIGYMRPRLNFVRMSGSDSVPILEESLRPVVLQDATGAPVTPQPNDAFYLELLAHDIGASVRATIEAGERVPNVELKKIDAVAEYTRYRSGPCFLYVQGLTSGEPRPAPPTGTTYVPAGQVAQVSATIESDMPGNTGMPRVQYRTGNRPTTRFDLLEIGDAEDDLRIPRPIIVLRVPASAVLPSRVDAGQLLVTVEGSVYDALADLDGAPPDKIAIDGTNYPLTPATERATTARPYAWKGTFIADVPVILGMSHIEFRVTNMAGEIGERSMRLYVTELNNRRSQPQTLRAEAWPYVPARPPAVPFLRCVASSCRPLVNAPLPLTLPVEVSAIAAYPDNTVTSQLSFSPPPVPCRNPVYQTEVFLAVSENRLSPSTALPPLTLRVGDGNRIQWRAALPNEIGDLPLEMRSSPITDDVALERMNAMGQWEPATLIERGDRLRILGYRALPHGGDRMEKVVSFVGPNDTAVDGPGRGIMLVLERVTGSTEFRLSEFLDAQYQPQPTDEILVRADGEEAPSGKAVLRIQGNGFVRLDQLRVPTAVLPRRYEYSGMKVPQELLGSGVMRVGPGSPCVVACSGEVVIACADMEVPARGLPMAIGRTWRSGNDYPGTLGWGWSASWDEFAWISDEGGVKLAHLFTEDGHLITFRYSGAEWEGPKGFYGKLVDGPGGLRLLLSEGMEKRYLPAGAGRQAVLRLITQEDRFGNIERWLHPAHGQPAAAYDSLARSIQLRFDRERGTLAAVGDWSGRDIEYAVATAPDADGDVRTLRQVRSPPIKHSAGATAVRRTIEYKWRPQVMRHALQSLNDPVGYGSAALMTFNWQPSGEVESVTYNGVSWVFSISGAAFSWIDPLGRTKTMTPWGSPPDGFAAPPALLEETLNGRTLRTTFTYNAHGELESRTLPTGRASEWGYDEQAVDPRRWGNLLHTVHRPAPGRAAEVTVSPVRFDAGAPFSATTVAELRTSATFDPTWQLMDSATTAGGRTTSWQIVEGSPAEEILPSITTSAGTVARIIKRTWNRWGQLLTETDPNGVVTRHFYYPVDDPSGLDPGSVAVSDPDTPGGYRAVIVHDAILPGVVRAAHLASARPVLETFRHDPLGRIISQRSGSGGASRWSFNAMGDVLAITHPDGAQVSMQLDLNGRVKEETAVVNDVGFPADLPSAPARTERHTFEYNRAGQQIEEVFDADGLKLKTTWEFDAMGRLEVERRPRCHDPSATRPFSTVNYEYDDLDRAIRTIVAKGSADGEFVTHTEYDDEGNIIDEWHPEPGGQRRNGSIYIWDGFGRRTTVADRQGNRTITSYDHDGRITVRRHTGSVAGEAVTAPANAPTLSEDRTFYDEAGHVGAFMERAFTLQATSAGWTEALIGAGFRASLFERDACGQALVATTDPPVVAATTTYDGHGLKVAESNGYGETAQYTYDDEDHLIQAVTTNSRGSVTVEVRRDFAGRALERLVNGISITQSRYDTLGRLRLRMDAYGNPTEFAYDGAGRRITTIWRLYEGGRRLAAGGTVAPISATEYSKETYDAESHLLSVTDPAGNVAETREFDDRGFVSKRTLAEDAFDITAPEPGGGTRHIQRDDHVGDSFWTYAWTPDGQAQRITDPDGRWIELDYDDSGRIEKRRAGEPPGVQPLGGSRIQVVTWDGLGRIVAATDDNGIAGRGVTIRQKYSSLGGIVEFYQAEDVTPALPRGGSSNIICGYERNGALRTLQWPWGLTVEHRPDAIGRIETIFDVSNGEEVVRYRWDGAMMTGRIHGGNRFGINLVHDADGRLQQHMAAKGTSFTNPADLLRAERYEYEPTGLQLRVHDLRSELTNPAGPHPVTVHGYDSRGRQVAQVRAENVLTPVAGIVPRTGSFQTYDRPGTVIQNRDFDQVVGRNDRYRYQPRPGVGPVRDAQTFVNGANQVGAEYRLIGGSANLIDTYRYDRRGNLRNDEIFEYAYDLHGRLIRVVSTLDQSSATILWDVLDRPVRIYVQGAQPSDRRLIWQGNDLIGEDVDAARFHFYLRGGMGEVVAFEKRDAQGRERYHVHTGLDTSVEFLTRPDGTDKVESYSYTSLGVPKLMLGGGATTPTGNRLWWQGHYYLKEFDLALVGPRAYHPILGRFLQPDPASSLANPLGAGNGYAYGGGNALAYSDDGHLPILLVVGVAFLVIGLTADAVAPVVGGWGNRLGAAQTIANFGILHNLAAAIAGEEFYSQEQLSAGERIVRGVGAVAALAGGLSATLGLLRAGSSAANLVAKVATAVDPIDNVVNTVAGLLAGNPVQAAGGALGICANRLCFLPGTLVITEEGIKPIERIEVGDRVFSCMPGDGERGFKEVTHVFSGQSDRIAEVRVALAEESDLPVRSAKLRCTPPHPFWVRDKGWVVAAHLQPGDRLTGSEGESLSVIGVDVHDQTVEHYNFEVEDWHSYFVQDATDQPAVLVHNRCWEGRAVDEVEKRMRLARAASRVNNRPMSVWAHLQDATTRANAMLAANPGAVARTVLSPRELAAAAAVKARGDGDWLAKIFYGTAIERLVAREVSRRDSPLFRLVRHVGGPRKADFKTLRRIGAMSGGTFRQVFDTTTNAAVEAHKARKRYGTHVSIVVYHRPASFTGF